MNIFLLSLSILYSQDATGDRVPQQQAVRKQKNGWDYYSEGNYLASIRSLEEEKKQFPGRINIYIILGWNYKALKNYQEMERVSIEGYNINPTHVNILRNLGEACYFQGKYNDSTKYFEKYLKTKNKWTDPNTYLIYFYLGYSYYRIGAYYRADVALSASNIARPNNVQNLLLLGNVNEKLEKKERAANYYEAVLKLDPENKEALSSLGRFKKGASSGT